MKPDIKAVIAFCCGILGLLTGYIDYLLAVACIAGVVGVISAVSAMKGELTPSGRGLAAAGMLSCLFVLCVSLGGLLGYLAARYLM